ncbi:hypothetical protein BASA82_001010 [Batrachochytrium salamandrivorans]|uniref:BZIP domain-containing protein n=1 Tax=Batrachochytrium salamandrivorans TaxID=1357716 RepID=A0ABQ8FIG1_9FUNG|nr:hypothetical protein BASA60_009796 [Batrachochytrium salamandrivorans]KAH6598850.1 hypothetical protein BASA50_003357 [Batrachochytrium salamandrivorans]KAH6602493.1 hypothetical protein BASA61_001059 [Batrachochytrium salamandrivorans]KAH9257119.1 hypothetical protein BASA81_004669 [Batrachochytrium salamandrivorans]KAH9261352.1 hypothetical protein BASA82_001010 [Batrachochytrium salamandrivorans]
MRLGSFAMVSLLAITVSAYPGPGIPPHNTDTDAMDQSQNVDIQEIGQPQDISAHSVQGFLDSATQNMDQFQGISDQEIDAFLNLFAQDPQPFPESDIQMSDQSQDAVTQILQYLQNSDTQSTEPSHGISAQNMHQSQYAATQSTQQPQDISIQDVQDFLDDAAQNVQQSPDAATQSAQQPQDISIQDVQDFLDDAAQNVQQSPDAATQSAHSSQDSGAQNMDQYQGISDQEVDKFLNTVAQSAERSEKRRLQNEVKRLKKARKRQHDRCFEIDSQVRADERRDKEVRGIIDRTFIKLQATDISDDERLRLQQKIYNLRIVLDQLVVRHKENHRSYTDATAKRRNLSAEPHIFRDNQRLIAVYNYQHGAQVGLSPNSYYNMDILKTQYDRVHRDIDESLVEQAKLRSAISVSDDGALKTQSAQLAYKIRDLQSYSRVAREIIWQHINGQPIGVWISKLLDPYIENDKIE